MTNLKCLFLGHRLYRPLNTIVAFKVPTWITSWIGTDNGETRRIKCFRCKCYIKFQSPNSYKNIKFLNLPQANKIKMKIIKDTYFRDLYYTIIDSYIAKKGKK